MLDRNENAELSEKLLACKRALFVGAHPDDIEFRAGGLVYLMKQRGMDVTFAIATRGGKRLPGLLGKTLERTRERQQAQAASILGGTQVLLFRHPDGDLSSHVEAFAADLATAIERLQPDVILSWDPDFIFTPHPDHKAAADAAKMVAGGFSTCWYGTAQPNMWVGLDDEALHAKVRALKAHKTETPWFYFDMRLKKRMIATMRTDGAEVGCDYAETFRFTPQT